MPVELKIEPELSEREKKLREIYGDPEAEWAEIEREYRLALFRQMLAPGGKS